VSLPLTISYTDGNAVYGIKLVFVQKITCGNKHIQVNAVSYGFAWVDQRGWFRSGLCPFPNYGPSSLMAWGRLCHQPGYGLPVTQSRDELKVTL